MNISVFGLGYVGTVSLGCLAHDGHHVIGVDISNVKLDFIRNGKSPVIEEGIQELIAEGVSSGEIEVSDETNCAIQNSDFSFVCVGTPSSPRGGQDLTAINNLSKNIGKALKSKSTFHIVVIRSTIFPGTLEDQIKPIIEEESGKKASVDFGLCFQPEFLREGSSIKDYYNPPYTIVGTDCEQVSNAVREIFNHLPGEFISTDIRTAEMLKFCCNSFHALKINFANEVGRISQAFGVDSRAVMELLCKDTKLNISSAYMKPGFAFGGSCLPKDLRALVRQADQINVQVPMLSNILPSNRIHIEHTIDMVLETQKKSVGLIGLSFKIGTDDLRESPLVILAEQFIGKGLNLKIYDPEVSLSRLIGANRRFIQESIPHITSLMKDRCEDLINESELIVVGQYSEEIGNCLKEKLRKDQIIIDLVGIPIRGELKSQYMGICW